MLLLLPLPLPLARLTVGTTFMPVRLMPVSALDVREPAVITPEPPILPALPVRLTVPVPAVILPLTEIFLAAIRFTLPLLVMILADATLMLPVFSVTLNAP